MIAAWDVEPSARLRATCPYCSHMADPDPYWYGTCGDPDCLAVHAYENGITLR